MNSQSRGREILRIALSRRKGTRECVGVLLGARWPTFEDCLNGEIENVLITVYTAGSVTVEAWSGLRLHSRLLLSAFVTIGWYRGVCSILLFVHFVVFAGYLYFLFP